MLEARKTLFSIAEARKGWGKMLKRSILALGIIYD